MLPCSDIREVKCERDLKFSVEWEIEWSGEFDFMYEKACVYFVSYVWFEAVKIKRREQSKTDFELYC
jgi:hypothetical protein